MRIVVATLLSSLLSLALWYGTNRPQPVEPSWDKPLASVSFAPYRAGQSPLTQVYPTDAQVEEDVRLAGQIARSVRTYASGEGMDRVLQLAGKYGLTVTHGAWLEAEGRFNDAEVDALIHAANTWPEVVKRVIVGNEVLLRGDLTPDQLIGYIREVRAAIKQPVSYADVWAFWLKYPQVANEVDFITIHILPYWEDEPAGVADAEQHMLKIVQKVQAAFPGKPIFIGEIGWPTAGRNRGPAVAGVEPAARFVRTVAQLAEAQGLDYNVVEAFDQEWKSIKEGTIGGNWGLFTSDRQLKIPLAGPVVITPDWPWRAAVSMALGILLLWAVARSLADSGMMTALIAALLAQGWGAMIAHAGFSGFHIAYTPFATATTALVIVVLVIYALLMQRAAVSVLARSGGATEMVTVDGILNALWPRLGEPAPQRIPVAETLMVGFVMIALITTSLLVFDGRYRDVPVNWYLVPVAAILLSAGLRLARGQSLLQALAFGRLFGGLEASPANCVRWVPDLIVAVLLLIAAIANIVGEGLTIVTKDFLELHPSWEDRRALVLHAMIANREILGWSAMLLAMALPFAANVVLVRRISSIQESPTKAQRHEADGQAIVSDG